VLLRFRVSNYRSIKGEQEFFFITDSRTESVGGDDWDSGVGTVAGIFGANASGKSNVLGALRFMGNAIESSYESWASKDSIPVTPFALDPSLERAPPLFEVVFQSEKIRYQYGFRATEERIVSEWLYAYVTRRRQVWFERDNEAEDEWHFGKSFTGRNRIIADLTGPTTLFLSAPVANNHKMARKTSNAVTSRDATELFRISTEISWPARSIGKPKGTISLRRTMVPHLVLTPQTRTEAMRRGQEKRASSRSPQ
jgi:uncharacterized protein